MKRPAILIGSAAVLVVAVVLLTFAGHRAKSRRSGKFGAETNHGRVLIGEGYFNLKELKEVFYTNNTSLRVTLENPVFQWKKPDGGIFNDNGVRWYGTNASISLGPNEVAMLPDEVPTNAPWYRMCCDYYEHAGQSQVHYAGPWLANKPLQPTATGLGN